MFLANDDRFGIGVEVFAIRWICVYLHFGDVNLEEGDLRSVQGKMNLIILTRL